MDLQFRDYRFHPDGANRVAAEEVGFRFGDRGTHTSRTMMLAELTTLLEASGAEALRDDYRKAIIDENCLSKATAATRRLTAQRMTELYGLDPELPLFRVLRSLWTIASDGRSQLAILAALGRDPLLAATATAILPLPEGAEFQRQPMRDALRRAVGDRLSDSTLDKVCRNAASSWTQAGHLEGRTLKKRRLVLATPVTLAYAAFLAIGAGYRSAEIFTSPWVAVLDVRPDRARSLAIEAKRLGLIDLNISGDIVALDVARMDPAKRGF